MSKEFGAGQLDPEIADLMGIAAAGPQAKPEFPQLFQDGPAVENRKLRKSTPQDLRFQTKLEEAPKPSSGQELLKLLGEQGEQGKGARAAHPVRRHRTQTVGSAGA
jgi:hypothetical protein